MNVKTIATLLKLAVIIAIVGFVGMRCFASGYSHYGTAAESGLPVPDSATDINHYKALTDWTYFDFKSDLETFKSWTSKQSGVKDPEFTENSEVFLSYSGKSDKLLPRSGVKHLKFFHTADKRSLVFIFVPEESRVYYSEKSE